MLAPAPTGKAAAVLKLLRRKRGATIGELQNATGWQPHSVRGFLSATVRKRMGIAVVSAVGEGGTRRYTLGGA